jgi:Fur family ferric uptake transcriptional regulator
MHHARATLRENGYRLTPQRNLIWEVLRDAGHHMSAEEVTARVKQHLPDVYVSTVYRTLELLVGLDLVVETRLEGSRCYYEVSPEPTHHHFVCTRCGAVGHFHDDLLAPVHTELGEGQGFAVHRIEATAFGLCRECSAAGEAPVAGDGLTADDMPTADDASVAGDGPPGANVPARSGTRMAGP